MLALPAGAGALASSGDGWTVQYVGTDTDALNAISFPDAMHGWAVGDNGTILATTDGGATWNAQTTGTAESFNAVSFPDATHGWVVGSGTNILATTDGGATWNVQVGNAHDWLNAVSFPDATHGWAVCAGFCATTDGGATWSNTFSSDILNGVAFPDATHGWAVGWGEDSATGTYPAVILATTDGGSTWNAQDAGTMAWLRAVDFPDDSHGWAVGQDGTILATTDGGATWNAQTTGTAEGFNAVSFPDDSHGWAVGLDGTILATSDGGATWNAQDWTYSPSVARFMSFNAVAFPDATHGWLLGEGEILATTNGGQPPAPTLTTFTPTSGRAGATVTLTGGFAVGASAVSFDGHDATFKVLSATKITAAVPSGAVTGKITVTTLGGVATSAASFTVTVTSQLTLKLSGLTSDTLRLGKRVTVKGTLMPVSLAGSTVTLTVQRESDGKWRKVTSMPRSIGSSGAYGWSYRPAKKGICRIRATIAKTAANTAAVTAWKTFKVK